MRNNLLILILFFLLLNCQDTKRLYDNIILNEGTELFKEGKFEEAKNIYLNGVNSNSKMDNFTSSQIHLLIATIYEKQDSLSKAEDFYLKAKQLDDSYWEIWMNLAIFYENKKDFINAEKCFDQSFELNPNDILLLNRTAKFYSKIGRNDKALNFINKSLKIDSLNESAIRMKTNILKK